MFRVHGSPTLATTTRAGEVDQRVAGKNAWQASDVEFVTSKLADPRKTLLLSRKPILQTAENTCKD